MITKTLRIVATRLNRSLSDTLEFLQHLGISGNAGADDTLASLERHDNRHDPNAIMPLGRQTVGLEPQSAWVEYIKVLPMTQTN